MTDDLDTVLLHESPAAGKGGGLTDHHFGDFELNGRSGAEVARHQCGVEDGSFIASESTAVLQTVDLGVEDRITELNALVVAASHDLAVLDEDTSDGDSALGLAFFGFVDSSLKKRVSFHPSRIRNRPVRTLEE